MGPTYEPGLSIDRKDNDGDYCLENCCWIPLAEQAKKKRTVRPVSLIGYVGYKTISDWMRDLKTTRFQVKKLIQNNERQ